MSSAYIYPRLFLRTPFLSYQDYAAGDIGKALSNAHFRLALYLASPVLFRLAEAKNFDPALLDEKELLSLEKYYNRMSFRPTPFGLFSAFTLTGWGNEGPIMLAEAAGALVHILPDQELTATLAAFLTADSLAGHYLPNPSLYRLGKEFRFIKTSSQDGSPTLLFSLESLEVNPLTTQLLKLLKSGAKTGAEILAFLVKKTGCSAEDALSYLVFLKDARVVFSSMDANITGGDYLRRLAPGLAKKFRTLRGSEAGPEQLKKLENELKGLLSQDRIAEPGKYLYVNTGKAPVSGALPAVLQQKVSSAVGALQKLALPSPNTLLTQFRDDFKSRFEDGRIPLLQAMDPDAGIGYGNLAEQNVEARLLKNLSFPALPAEPAALPWSPVHRLLLEKWNQAGKNNPIRLTGQELDRLDTPELQLPPSLSVMFRVAREGLQIESAGGATATSLIGRFSILSGQVGQLGRELAALEKDANPGVLFAEIAQLSDMHVDNVNRRLAVYDYEIPVNCISLLPHDRQLALNDLVISVRGQEVILESLRLKKRVIPRLSSAYNFRRNNLALFRFLCDLQYQSLQADLSFDLEHYFPGMPFYPRVEFAGTIISPAKWHIKTEAFGGTLAALRAELKLPRYVALTRFDQQLVFNLDDPEQANLFQQCTRNRPEFTLQEFLLPSAAGGPVRGADGRPFIDQFLAFLISPKQVYPAVSAVPAVAKKIQKDFILGSGWLYLKIYCSPNTSNEMLTQHIFPFIRELSRDPAAHWFFIRYSDPGPHIRLRIKVDEQAVGHVVSRLKDQFAGLVSNHIVREYRADTYRRELGRYGADLIETVELLFEASSELVIHFIRNNAAGRYDIDQLAINSFAMLLDALLPDLPEQLQFLEALGNSFYAEFNGDKSFRVELDKSYRSLKQDFSLFIKESGFYKALKITKALRLFKSSLETLAGRAAGFDHQRKTALLGDLIHMHLNRVYNDRQRQQEMMLYYCFYKYKLSRAAILKQAAAVTPALDHQALHRS